ncbi:hypothetical protein [Psychrobium sp. 1_MG-2023]|uniref:hypothetical protein n=1 Tax=Psychrobium sp. 1_MG-2023 TaxID=3062624 RepID=UPI000C3446B7|nr:hypothetical protein [Psychrobium sp. 1_MG-2023]MDP2561437.1 hypothetical protein [Psychrobium sp. 1_MG-2023]PKF57704.1 hypothetical protein CW748_05790 [Alteromonadales bacterium alter-6D02]
MNQFYQKLLKCSLVAMTLFVSSAFAKTEFCPLPQPLPSEKEQDELFVEAMFEADYIFKGRLFTFYHEQCDGEICAFDGLVFKVLEEVYGHLNLYVETGWSEDCERVWLHPQQWRQDKDVMFFEIDKEYLLLANDTPKGIMIIGSRGGAKVKELKMRYELERIGRK